MKRVVVGILVVLGLLGLGLATRLERGPSFEPWIDPLPEHAVSVGYWNFRQSEGGYAVDGWAEWWMARRPPRGDGPLLIDKRHATKQPEDAAIGLEDYAYLDMHGFRRAFEPLRADGVRTRGVYQPWTPGELAGASGVFINLVSGDNPGFRTSEVQALVAFVRAGGGLVLITDHTNCYFHGEMLQALSQELGFEIRRHTAADKGRGKTLSPRSVAWVRTFSTGSGHPVGRDVEVVGWMTGGIVEPREDSAFVPIMQGSETGWADLYLPHKKDDSSGFTGNLKRDEDEEPGPHSTVLAGQVGQGRVVVLADQNAWGSTLIGYEDNHRLFTNAVAWALGRDVELEVRGPRSVTTIGGHRSLCTSAAEFGYRTLQVQSQRLSEHLALPEHCTSEASVASQGLVLLPEAERDDLEALLDGAERVLAIVDVQHAGSRQLLELLGLGWSEAGEPAQGLRWRVALEGPEHRVFDSEQDLEPISVSPLALDQDLEVLAEDALGRPAVVRLERGSASLILVLDPRLLQNEALGGERQKPWVYGPEREAAHRLALRLLWAVYPKP